MENKIEKTSMHKILYEGNHALRLYRVRHGGYWWGIHPAGLLFPKDEDYTEEGFDMQESLAWRAGVIALDKQAQVESH
jgi:hypothetical protein